MWRGNDECNEAGEPIRLYQPIQYGRSNVDASDLTASFVGGPPSATRQCTLCQRPLMTLAQLHVPGTEKTLRIEACNSAPCFRSLFRTSKFSFGGKGVVACDRLSTAGANDSSTSAKPMIEKPKAKMSQNEDWGVSGDDEVDLDDLEAKLAAMEAKPKAGSSTATTGDSPSRPAHSKSNTPQSGLPILALSSLQEPADRNTSADPRDVGLHGTSNRKIEEMLARYLADEEDQDLVQMLQGTVSGGTEGQEPDQDLTEEEMALLRFSDRLKRCPRQVLRYAYGGDPLWSIPPPKVSSPQQKQRGRATKQSQNESQIPPCQCGAARVFECQILPSVLHILNVDKYAEEIATGYTQLNDWYAAGGMDFGSISVYTCSKESVCTEREEFVVIQDTADEQPTAPTVALRDVGDVVVDENAVEYGDQDMNDEE